MEVVTLSATLLIAVAASFIAWKANSIADNANQISQRSARLEADKQLIDWARRVLACFSAVVSLRHQSESSLDQATFYEYRRKLRSELYALKEEGYLYFSVKDDGDEKSIKALAAIESILQLSGNEKFSPPEKGDYDTVRSRQVAQIRRNTRTFLDDVKPRIDSHWLTSEH